MQVAKHQGIIAPFAWTGADVQESTVRIRLFRFGELQELDRAHQGVRQRAEQGGLARCE